MMMRLLLPTTLVLLSSCIKTITADLLSTQHTFADTLTPILYNANNSTNDCSSALGVSMAFGLVYPSMIDLAQEETASLFGFTSDNMEIQWAETERTLEGPNDGSCVIETNKPPCSPQYPTLRIANSIWLNAARTVNADYASVVQEYVQEIDFAATDAGNRVNAWVNQSTNGLIDSIVDNGPLAGVPLIAINTIYLKAEWAKPFRQDFTSQDVFYTSAARLETSHNAMFLHAVDYMAYTETDTHQMVSLPFSSNGASSPLAMVIALPFVEEAPMVTAQELATPGLLQFASTPVALALPKFEFRSEYSDTLKSALQTIGLSTPFQTGLCIYDDDDEDCTTAVDRIIQKTFISLNEQGVEAAAVTAIIGRNFPLYPDNSTLVLVDHPFQFFLHDQETGVVLFEGRVVFPETKEEAAPITTNHTADTYWENQFRVTTLNRVETKPAAMTTTAAPMTTTPIVPVPVDEGNTTTTTTAAPVMMIPATSAPVVVTNTPTASPSTLPTQSPQQETAAQVERSPAVRPLQMLMTLGALLVLLLL